MNLILYVHQDSSGKGEIFKRVMEKNFKNHEMELFQTFNAFKARAKNISHYHKEIYILFADSRKRLEELATLADLLEGKSIILILPDNSKMTISLALKIYPRFFTQINDTYKDLCQVLTRMIDREKI